MQSRDGSVTGLLDSSTLGQPVCIRHMNPGGPSLLRPLAARILRE